MGDITRTDCISRQALLDKTVNKNSIWKSITNSSGENLEEIINGLPSVPSKPQCIAVIKFDKEQLQEIAKDIVEECADCISREATKEAIRKRFPSLHDRCEVNIVINSMPSVLPKANQSSGKWIWCVDEKRYKYCKCSQCGIGMGQTEYDFCPNCGADMREDDTDEST